MFYLPPFTRVSAFTNIVRVYKFHLLIYLLTYINVEAVTIAHVFSMTFVRSKYHA